MGLARGSCRSSPGPATGRSRWTCAATAARTRPPNGYDPVTLAQDVSGVVKALGGSPAVVVGHGWGGYVGWATAALHPREVRALRRLRAAPADDAARAAARPRRGRPAARAGHAGADAARAAAGRPLLGVPRRAPAHLDGRRVRVPGPGHPGDVPAGDQPVALVALRAGVPPLAVPLPAARRRAALHRADAAAGHPAGLLHHRDRRRGPAGARGGAVPAARHRATSPSTGWPGSGTSRTRRTRRPSSGCCCPGSPGSEPGRGVRRRRRC